MQSLRKYAIVTPYYDEPRGLIERCLESVAAQDGEADHILVADGLPQSWLDGMPVRHLKLDRPHRDFGNTPRGIGLLLAICDGYEGIGLLDADNWLDKNHLSSCLAAAKRVKDCDFVIARRTLRRPDGSIIDIPDEPISQHVDTSCFFFLPGSFHVLPHFAMQPKELSVYGDRVFYDALKFAKLVPAAASTKTVNYLCLQEAVYKLINETPPEGARPYVDPSTLYEWLDRRSPRELLIASRLAGAPFNRLAVEWNGVEQRVGRNESCPCGSGRKFKHCHGRLF